MQATIVYKLEIVGGPFDGVASGLRWFDDGNHPLPEIILMGTCPGDGMCNTSESAVCKRKGRAHPYFWLVDEQDRPTRVTAYELEDNYLEPAGDAPAEARRRPGRAIYSIGGLQLPHGRELAEHIGPELEYAADSTPLPGAPVQRPVHAGYPEPA